MLALLDSVEWLFGLVAVVLTGLIGLFFRSMHGSVKELTTAVGELKTSIAVIQNRMDALLAHDIPSRGEVQADLARFRLELAGPVELMKRDIKDQERRIAAAEARVQTIADYLARTTEFGAKKGT